MDINLKNEYSIKIIDTIEDIKTIRDFWTKHQHHIYSDIDYYLFSFKNDPEFLQPFITVLYKKEIPESIIVGRIATRTLDWKIGPQKFGKSETRCLEIGYHGFLGNFSFDTTRIMIKFLIQSLKKIKVSFIYFDRINTESTIFAALRKIPNLINRDFVFLKYKNYKLKLPDSFEAFYKTKSRSTKKMINSYRNRLKNKFGENCRIKSYLHEDQVDIALKDIHDIAMKSYLQAMGQGFQNSETDQKKWLFLAKRSNFRADIMYINKRPCAFWLGNSYKGKYFLSYTGYDPEFHYYHVGTVVLIYVIEKLSQDPNCHEIDYGLGTEAYKKMFGNECNNVANFMIYSSSLKGQIIKVLRLLTIGSTQLAKKLLIQFRIIKFFSHKNKKNTVRKN